MIFTPIVESQYDALPKITKGNERYSYPKPARENTDFSRDHSGYLKDIDIGPRKMDVYFPVKGTASISISKRNIPQPKPRKPSVRRSSHLKNFNYGRSAPTSVNKLRPAMEEKSAADIYREADTIFSNNDVIDALNRAKKAKQEAKLTRDLSAHKINRPTYKQFHSFFDVVKNKKDKFNYLESESIFRGSLRQNEWKENLKKKKDLDITADMSYNLEHNQTINLSTEGHNQSSVVQTRNNSNLKITTNIDDILRPNSRQAHMHDNSTIRPASRQTNPNDNSILVKEYEERENTESTTYQLNRIGSPPRPRTGISNKRQFRLSRPTSFIELNQKSLLPRSQNRPDYRTLYGEKSEAENTEVMKSIEMNRNNFKAKNLGYWPDPLTEVPTNPEAHAERALQLSKECDTILQELHSECDKYSNKIKLKLRNDRENIGGPYLTFSRDEI